ncbi:hypothetical protein TWF696_004595 [Orbilia brochopaga]|uniref:Fungal-type protein kinase domain-containing protein n=1 Tax=Orbilia brochopaga TaxID=3140254 RepID=A0AAV9VAH4_9PEZI
MPCTSCFKEQHVNDIERSRASAFTIQIQFRQSLIYRVDTNDRRTYNYRARLPHSSVNPIVARRENNGFVTYEYPDPEIFPATVAQFVRMNASKMMYLLAFYDLTAIRMVWSAEGNWRPRALVIPLTEDSIEEHKYECMTPIAQHLGLKLWKIHDETLDLLRASSTFKPDTYGST